MPENYVEVSSNLSVSEPLHREITRILAPHQISGMGVWSVLENIIHKFSNDNQELLLKRERLQKSIDNFWIEKRVVLGEDFVISNDILMEQLEFLRSCCYIDDTNSIKGGVSEGGDIDVDAELLIPAPQLVVPVDNARYAVNAVNSRWNSLYDAIYGSDIIGKPLKSGTPYQLSRGVEVVKFCMKHLDKCASFGDSFAWSDIQSITMRNLNLFFSSSTHKDAPLPNSLEFIGYFNPGDRFRDIPVNSTQMLYVLRHRPSNLHLILHHNLDYKPGEYQNGFLISDITVEAATTAILDFEDSVSVVDGEDKAVAYSNLAGILGRTITVDLGKGVLRRVLGDLEFWSPNGKDKISLRGPCLCLVRNVGIHMRTEMVLYNGQSCFEGLIDTVITSFVCHIKLSHLDCSLPDKKLSPIYIVKPKLHGPEEVKFMQCVFKDVETLMGIPNGTIKVGLMDEERRTSVNLSECISLLGNRIFFINTGFLDRTGDEIHTSRMLPVAERGELKKTEWFLAYEDNNVKCGILSGLSGRAQIGKGMWAEPDSMKSMYESKGCQLLAGASTAWVPSPSAASIHCLHYHLIDVLGIHSNWGTPTNSGFNVLLLKPPVCSPKSLTKDLIGNSVRLSLQSILGYVTRWVQLGIGCSKISDIRGIGLMEDRATLRISCQHLANWIRHNIVTHAQFDDILEEVKSLVDSQNSDTEKLVPLCVEDPISSLTNECCKELISTAFNSPCGYTEKVLVEYRKRVKDHKRKGNSSHENVEVLGSITTGKL